MGEFCPRILIVEDDPAEAELLVRILTRAYKCEIDIAFDLEEVKRRVSDNSYDVVITDAFVRDFSASEVAEAVRNGNSSPLLYLLSEDPDPLLVKRFMEDGVDIFLQKTFHYMDILAMSIKNILTKKKL